MHSTDVQKKVLKEDVLAITRGGSKDELVELRRHFEAHKMNGNDGKIEQMVSWSRSTRVSKRGVTKRVNQDIRNMMNVRVK